MKQPPICNAFVKDGCEPFSQCGNPVGVNSLVMEMCKALKATQKVLRHASQMTTVQMRNNKKIQISTVRAAQAQHELKKVDAVIAKYDKMYPKKRTTK